MPFSVVMPALEMAQETGKLVAWRKKEGESVSKGEPLLEVETDKAVLEVESPAEGVLAGVSASVGAVIPVGQTIAWILRPGESAPQEIQPSHSTRSTQVSAPSTPPSAGRSEHGQSGGTKISPKARRLAQEQGIDIAQLRGSGPDGEILTSDVLAAKPETAPGSGQLETPGAVGRLMAERTTRSWTTTPHFFVSRDVDATELNAAREKLAPPGVRVTHTDLLVAATAQVLAQHPRVNATWIDGKIRLNPEINVAIAMAIEDGVVATVIRDAPKLGLPQIAHLRSELTERARQNQLRPTDISGATFTISNLGMYHVDAFSAILPPGQSAILAVGAIADRVVAHNGQAVVRPMMTLTLSCDHRVIDGARAARFLEDLVEALRRPEKWLR